MPILLTRDLAPAPSGSSGVRIMADQFGQKYFVKFKENAQFLKVLVNEYIAGKIAEKLGLPSPQVHIVHINPILVPEMAPINQIAISEGPHFGSLELQNLYSLPIIREVIGKCCNINQYPAIVLFDAFLYNSDRRNDGNFIVTTVGEDLKFNIIDHGFCFSQQWNAQILTEIEGQWSDAYLPEMYETIVDRSVFDEPLAVIERLTDDFFTNLVSEIPEEWLKDPVERNALSLFLCNQRHRLRGMLAANIDKFPNLV